MPAVDFLGALRALGGRSAPNLHVVFDEVVCGLLKNRDFLGLQLDRAWGNLSDEDFNSFVEEKGYLADPRVVNEAELIDKVLTLLSATSCRIDSDVVSIAFGCTLEQSERALSIAAAEMRHGLEAWDV